MIVLFFTFLLFVIAATLTYLAYRKGGQDLRIAFVDAKQQFMKMLPLLALGILGSGFLARLLPREIILSWFGASSGFSGIALACIAGALSPGGPVVGYALGAAALKAGAGMPQTVAFVTAWSLFTINRILMWEVPSVPRHLLVQRLIVSLPLPFLAAALAQMFLVR